MRDRPAVVAHREHRAARRRNLDPGRLRTPADGGVSAPQELEQRLPHALAAVLVAAPRCGHAAAAIEDQATCDIGRKLAEVIEGQGRSQGCSCHAGHNNAVPLSRIAWLTTVAILVIAAALVLLNGYVGYFFVLVAVAAAAAINVR